MAEETFSAIASGSDYTYDIDIDTQVQGKPYKGTIKVKLPTIKDEIKIRVKEATLREGVPASSFDDFSLFVIRGFALLSVVAVSLPSGEKDVESLPPEVVVDFFSKYLDKTNFFRKTDLPEDKPNI